ncbi:GGDEF domain-containing protein [Ningiella sp. W23]|uniref:GGDEF domain-containing protein n=1 Tax=Ningiella sp. W23 TaxID=3023715 RepID=UPI003756BCF0
MHSFRFFALAIALVTSNLVFAELPKTPTDIDLFISESKTVTYDCPKPESEKKVDALLEENSISLEQRNTLTTIKTHNLICRGKEGQARDLLVALTQQSNIDKSTEYYANAIYQIGFTYDVQERSERCEYYLQALERSRGKFADIEMSASLGLINYCPSSGYSTDSKRLAAFFELVEQFAGSDDRRTLAHIHNNIGLFFGEREQHVLAAEQFLKAHEIGTDVYEGSNRLSILISAISSLIASGQYDRTKEALDEFKRINKDVSTQLTNFWYYYAKSGYHYRVNEMNELAETLPSFKSSMPSNNDLYEGLYRWYSAVLCVHRNDLACVREFVETERKVPVGKRPYRSYDFYKFLIRANFALGDIEAANEAFENSLIHLDRVKYRLDGFSKIIGVANLYSQIYVLENEIAASERRKQQLIYATVAAAALTFFILVLLVRRRQIARQALDPVTSLFNNKTAVGKISRVESPSKGKSNAIAIFDLGNFREVNRQLGSTKGDYALQRIANTLKKVTRDKDILGRFAPEQFILCLPDIEEESAKSFFERVQSALESTFKDEQNGENVSIRSSMSIYISSGKFNDLDTVLDEMLLSLSISASK